LPLNPQAFANLSPLLAFNVAMSFMTTTDWQAYAGESMLSYLAQMMLARQNFVAAVAHPRPMNQALSYYIPQKLAHEKARSRGLFHNSSVTKSR